MPLITCEFADGHSEESEFSCEVAQMYAQSWQNDHRCVFKKFPKGL